MIYQPTLAMTEGPTKNAVLIVDDERPLLDVYAAALSPFFEVTLAATAREGEIAARQTNFKAVVADHLMPGGTGMDLLILMRKEFPHMQRILVTGYMKPEMLLRTVREAALFRYLLKPVPVADLVKVVADAMVA
ncbi:MAG: response regulator, partial [Opitutaceae bacterium]